MAQYKVPQDVEAEDKLLGPFTFRQFMYLIIAAIFLAAAWGLFNVFPLLGVIPLPIAGLFAVLALPIKKDQPMETYLTAVVNFHTKPRKRTWTPGQQESTITITAPKTVEKPRSRDITEEEASHRLSFLADIIDTEGRSIRDVTNSTLKEEYAAEASTIPDVLDTSTYPAPIDYMIAQEQNNRHAEIVAQMRAQLEAERAKQPTPQINLRRP
jgi:hypothetical protein